MYKRILFPTDGSEITAKAVQTAIAIARLCGAELFVLAVKEPFPYSAISEMQPVPPQEFYDAQERVAAARVKEATDLAAGLTSHGHTVGRTARTRSGIRASARPNARKRPAAVTALTSRRRRDSWRSVFRINSRSSIGAPD